MPLLTALFLAACASFFTSSSSPSSLERQMEQYGLVDVQQIEPSIFVSLMYARSDNFVGKTLYKDLRRAYLLPHVALALQKAQRHLQKKYPQYSLKVYDATRPMSVQRLMWKTVAGTNKAIYVSNPKRGGGLHNYGLAVDVTLCWSMDVIDRAKGKHYKAGDTTGISMGTPIDYFGKLAHVRGERQAVKSGLLSKQHLYHRQILRNAMETAGFRVLPTEWWHFNFTTRAEAQAKYTPIP